MLPFATTRCMISVECYGACCIISVKQPQLTMIARATKLAIVAPLLSVIGCAHTTAAAGASAPSRTYPFTASSLAGKYVLRGTFSGNVTVRSDSIIVVASSALLANRMRTSPKHSPLFHDLTVQAYVAVPDGRSWRVASQSDQVPIAPLGMDADTTISIAPLRFAIPRPRNSIAEGWLAFQLSGRDLPGSPLYQDGQASFRTYVCSGQYLAPAPGDSTLVARQVSDSPLTC